MFCSLPLLRPNFNKKKKRNTRNVFKIPNMLFYFQFKIPRSRTKPDRFCSFWAYERIKQVLYTWPTSNFGSLDSFFMLNKHTNFFFKIRKFPQKCVPYLWNQPLPSELCRNQIGLKVLPIAPTVANCVSLTSPTVFNFHAIRYPLLMNIILHLKINF